LANLDSQVKGAIEAEFFVFEDNVILRVMNCLARRINKSAKLTSKMIREQAYAKTVIAKADVKSLIDSIKFVIIEDHLLSVVPGPSTTICSDLLDYEFSSDRRLSDDADLLNVFCFKDFPASTPPEVKALIKSSSGQTLSDCTLEWQAQNIQSYYSPIDDLKYG
jgi:hypothetical protein